MLTDCVAALRYDGQSVAEPAGLTHVPIANALEGIRLLRIASERRATRDTMMNAISSRSHCVYTVHMTAACGSTTTCAKLHLVDLAGSERVVHSGATGARLVLSCDLRVVIVFDLSWVREVGAYLF